MRADLQLFENDVGSDSPAGGLRCAVGFCDCTKRCPWRARLHHQSSSRTLVAQWSVPRATRPTLRKRKSAAVETKEETLTRLTQTGESSSLDLKEVGQRCDSIHWRSISSEWIRSLSHSLSGGWVARPAKCEPKLLCSTRDVEFRFFPPLVEVGLRS